MITLKHTLETDVLVVGGGIGGLCAAISAAQGRARVTVLEKANSKRSGSGATGNDHYTCYCPKAHGSDISVILKELLDSMLGLCHDTKLSVRFLERSISIADKWHEWGINMKPFGDDYVFMGHAFPGRPRIFLKYDGHNQKQVLTAQARKAGAHILNHHPVLDLLRNEDGITGALALDMSGKEPAYTVVRAKKVILATGAASRLYPPAGTPGWLFNTAFCPSCTGSAQAQSWRIGAKLVNMELPNRHAGPKFFSRSSFRYSASTPSLSASGAAVCAARFRSEEYIFTDCPSSSAPSRSPMRRACNEPSSVSSQSFQPPIMPFMCCSDWQCCMVIMRFIGCSPS